MVYDLIKYHDSAVNYCKRPDIKAVSKKKIYAIIDNYERT